MKKVVDYLLFYFLLLSNNELPIAKGISQQPSLKLLNEQNLLA